MENDFLRTLPHPYFNDRTYPHQPAASLGDISTFLLLDHQVPRRIFTVFEI